MHRRHHRRRRLAVALTAVALATTARASEALSASDSAKIDAIATRASQIATRTFGKTASFCAAQQLPAHVQVDVRLTDAASTIETATRDALVEMAHADPTFLATMPVPSDDELGARDRDGDELLRIARAEPFMSCGRLAMSTAPRPLDDFKAELLADFRARAATRAQHCAAAPRPADCP